jgi:hypothetical protein
MAVEMARNPWGIVNHHRRFAFHVPEGFPDAMEAGGRPVIDGPANFPTAWFTQRQHALDWLGRE